LTFKFHTKPFPYQKEEFDNSKDIKAYAHLWEQGCVDAETEYLSPSGWRRIDRYRGEPVAQYDSGTGKINFVEPVEYIKEPCEKMVHFYNKEIDQMLTPNHRVLFSASKYQNYPLMFIKSVTDICDDGKDVYMPRLFKYDMTGEGLGMTEPELRLMTILIIQGRRTSTNGTDVRFRASWPEDRQDRLIRFLKLTGTKSTYSTTRTAGKRYQVKKAYDGFDHTWWNKITNKERDIIVDEAFRWTLTQDNQLYTDTEENADFIQFIACSQGFFSYSKRRQEKGWVISNNGTKLPKLKCIEDIYPEYSSDGFKYCFKVPTTFLVLRRSGRVFITGNTGKSKLNIDEFQYLYDKGEVDSLFVVAPNGVHRNWITDELPAHLPPELLEKAEVHFYESKRAKTKWHKQACADVLNYKGLSILAMTYEGFMTKAGKKLAWDFLTKRKCYYVLDEAQKIKSPGAKRTKSIVASGRYATYKRVLSGTLGAEGPFDLYTPMKFLDPEFWKRHHLGSFAAYKSFFGVWQKRQQVIDEYGYDPGYDKLLSYKNLDKLRDIIKTISSRVTKDSAGLGIPDKLYSKIYFDMNPEQWRAYNQLKEEYMTIIETGEEDGEGMMVDAALPIVRMMRLQQITCGYASTGPDEPLVFIGKNNPRIDATIAHLEDATHQAIIWARFSPEIDVLMERLGDRGARYDGKMTSEDAAISLEAFRRGDKQHFVANPQKGATGITVINATESIYHSNSYSLEMRLQSEDRNHRIGQHNAVTYNDVVCPGTGDEKIADALRNKYDVAAQIRGDELKEWI